jgi:hypothetical protein
VSPFGTARFTYAQRYATSVLLWAWGEGGGEGGRSAGRVVKVVVRQAGRPI